MPDGERPPHTPRIPLFRWPIGRARSAAARGAPKSTVPPRLVELAGLDTPQVLASLEATQQGLLPPQVAARRQIHGENRVARDEHETLPAQLLRRLLNPLNILLLTLATVSAVMRDREAAAIIFGMVALSLSLGIVQERRSSKAAQKLRAMVRTKIGRASCRERV
jgi:Mg2+-importing ATPase